MNILSGINKKLFNYILIALGVVIGIFILIFILSLFKSKTYSFSEIEAELKSGAVAYYKKNQELLPTNEGDVATVDDVTLSEAGVMKQLTKMVNKNYTCSGSVSVQKNGDYYLYTPVLECGEKYKTSSLVAKIKSDNPVVKSGDGLYQINNDLVFRGEYVNNFVRFSNITWRIVKIESDNSLRLVETDKILYTDEVWDDRYNINRDDSVGINDFELSRIKDGLNRIYYEKDTFNDSAKEKIILKHLCIGKRDEESSDNSGSIECATLSLEAMPVGLLLTNEYVLASIDPNCKHIYDASCNNYNYMGTLEKTTWTLTADSSNTHKAYKLAGSNNSSSSAYFTSNCSNESGLRMVIYVNGNISYISGDGTEENPYIIK